MTEMDLFRIQAVRQGKMKKGWVQTGVCSGSLVMRGKSEFVKSSPQLKKRTASHKRSVPSSKLFAAARPEVGFPRQVA